MLGLVAEMEPERFGRASAFGGVISAVSIFLVMNLTAWLVERVGEPLMWKAMLFPVCWARPFLAFGFICVGAGGALWLAVSGRSATVT